MNHVGLVGRITKDPELRYYNEKKPYTVFTVAINRPYKNDQGQVDADFIQCAAWGKLAENVSKYCGKGSIVGVNGRLSIRQYVVQQQSKVNTTEVVAEDVRFYSLKPPATSSLAHFNIDSITHSAPQTNENTQTTSNKMKTLPIPT